MGELSFEIGKRVRLNTITGKIEGRLACIERNDDDSVYSVMIRTLSLTEVGSMYFTMEEINTNGWTLEDISAEPFGMEAAVVQYIN